MKLIVCLDDRNGMLFLGRRQSQDAALRRRILELTREGVLWMNSYSARQFTESASQIRIHERFWEVAGEEDFCFAENVDVAQFMGRLSRLILYRWNRHYPSDVKFPVEQLPENRKLLSCLEFPGSSHDCITEEVYSL